MDSIHRKHEAQRAAWAAGWFFTLLKARRNGEAAETQRAADGLAALGIRVTFDEDAADEIERARLAPGTDPGRRGRNSR